jgi:hypothetical protein
MEQPISSFCEYLGSMEHSLTPQPSSTSKPELNAPACPPANAPERSTSLNNARAETLGDVLEVSAKCQENNFYWVN